MPNCLQSPFFAQWFFEQRDGSLRILHSPDAERRSRKSRRLRQTPIPPTECLDTREKCSAARITRRSHKEQSRLGDGSSPVPTSCGECALGLVRKVTYLSRSASKSKCRCLLKEVQRLPGVSRWQLK